MSRHQAGRSWATAGSDVLTATTAPDGSVSIASRRSINRPVPTPSAPPSTRAAGSGNDSLAMIASYQPLAGEALLLDGVEEDTIAGHHVRRGGDPALEPFQVHQFAPARVVVAHGQERFGPPPPAFLGEFREDREVTVAVTGRRPDRADQAAVDPPLGHLSGPGRIAEHPGVGAA